MFSYSKKYQKYKLTSICHVIIFSFKSMWWWHMINNLLNSVYRGWILIQRLKIDKIVLTYYFLLNVTVYVIFKFFFSNHISSINLSFIYIRPFLHYEGYLCVYVWEARKLLILKQCAFGLHSPKITLL